MPAAEMLSPSRDVQSRFSSERSIRDCQRDMMEEDTQGDAPRSHLVRM